MNAPENPLKGIQSPTVLQSVTLISSFHFAMKRLLQVKDLADFTERYSYYSTSVRHSISLALLMKIIIINLEGQTMIPSLSRLREGSILDKECLRSLLALLYSDC